MILSEVRFCEIASIIRHYEGQHQITLIGDVMLMEALEAINEDGTLGDVTKIDVPKKYVQDVVSLMEERGLTRNELLAWAMDDFKTRE